MAQCRAPHCQGAVFAQVNQVPLCFGHASQVLLQCRPEALRLVVPKVIQQASGRARRQAPRSSGQAA